MPEKRLKSEAPPAPKDPDKVWLTLDRKYRVEQYESLSVSLGAASYLHPEEDIRDGLKRVFAQLRAEFNDVVEVMREQEGC